MSPPRPPELEASWRLVDYIRRYAAGLTAVHDTHFGTDYIADGQVLALETLRLDGPSLVAEIAEATELTSEAVLRFMRELRTRRLVTSSRAADDRRQRTYQLSDAGWEASRRTDTDLEAFFASAAANAREIAQLTESDGRLAQLNELGTPDAWALAANFARTGQELSRAIVARLGEAREQKVQGRSILAVIAIASHAEMRPSALANELGISAASATYLIDALERHGLATRERNSAGDRRTKRVVASAEGLAAAVAVHDALQEIKPSLHAVFTQAGTIGAAQARDQSADPHASGSKIGPSLHGHVRP